MNSVLGTAATRFGRLIVEETVRSPHSTKTVLPGRFGSFLTFPPSFATVALARTMLESPAATPDLAVLPGVLGSRTLRRTKTKVRLQIRAPAVARWHGHLHDLATAPRT